MLNSDSYYLCKLWRCHFDINTASDDVSYLEDKLDFLRLKYFKNEVSPYNLLCVKRIFFAFSYIFVPL